MYELSNNGKYHRQNLRLVQIGTGFHKRLVHGCNSRFNDLINEHVGRQVTVNIFPAHKFSKP